MQFEGINIHHESHPSYRNNQSNNQNSGGGGGGNGGGSGSSSGIKGKRSSSRHGKKANGKNPANYLHCRIFIHKWFYQNKIKCISNRA